MAKLTPIEKLQAVQMYLEGTESQDTVAKSAGVSKAILQTWIRQFQHHGELSFIKGYTSYSADYKLMVLNYISEHGTSIREAAAIFNIPTHSLLSRWRKELETEGVDALKPKKKERPLMKEEKKPSPPEGSAEALQAEVERLRMENAYLKKLNALVQSKGKLRSKTKRK
jgi:transposase